jgi:hypothetical protein
VLRPGETFCTVPATVALGVGWQAALRELTKHRRLARRPHPDNERLTVIYNDYMNTLMGDATTKRLLSLVDAAAEASADAFCIDAGRYDTTMQGFAGWWDYVGEWQPSIVRFPNGITEVFDRIRERGLVPGLWLEPEVVGVRILVCLPSEPTKVGTGLGIAAGQVAQAGFWMSVSAIHPLRMNIKVMLDFSCCRCALWSVGGDCVGVTGDRFGSSWSLTHAPTRGSLRRLREGRLREGVQRLLWRFCYETLARRVQAVARHPTPQRRPPDQAVLLGPVRVDLAS